MPESRLQRFKGWIHYHAISKPNNNTSTAKKGKQRYSPTVAKRDIGDRMRKIQWRMEMHTVSEERAKMMNECLDAMDAILKGERDGMTDQHMDGKMVIGGNGVVVPSGLQDEAREQQMNGKTVGGTNGLIVR